jgi:hypothetical protein
MKSARHAPEGLITPARFPTPHILIRVSNGEAQSDLGEFASLQAHQAKHIYRMLCRNLSPTLDSRRREAVIASAFSAVELWRYRLAAARPSADGRYSAIHAENFRTQITNQNPNYFPVGDPRRFREGAVWDEQQLRYAGGSGTPASRTMEEVLRTGNRRFDRDDSDFVVNEVRLPSGQTVPGARLLRNSAAAEAASVIASRIAARGGDTSRCHSNDEMLYVASASERERRVIFRWAMWLLAQPGGEGDVAERWVRAAYMLYQAPRRKRGVDAVIRTFLVPVGLYMSGSPPTLPHQLDLLAYAHSQPEFHSVTRQLLANG